MLEAEEEAPLRGMPLCPSFSLCLLAGCQVPQQSPASRVQPKALWYLAQFLAHGGPREMFIDCSNSPNLPASQDPLNRFLTFPALEFFSCDRALSLLTHLILRVPCEMVVIAPASCRGGN